MQTQLLELKYSSESKRTAKSISPNAFHTLHRGCMKPPFAAPSFLTNVHYTSWPARFAVPAWIELEHAASSFPSTKPPAATRQPTLLASSNGLEVWRGRAERTSSLLEWWMDQGENIKCCLPPYMPVAPAMIFVPDYKVYIMTRFFNAYP